MTPDEPTGFTKTTPALALAPTEVGTLTGSAGTDAEAGVPARLGRYLVLDRLGHGGMGVVYSAYDPQLDRKVAIKLLRHVGELGAEGQKRLLREAQAMAKLSHINVIAVHDVGIVDEQLFIAMEFIKGQTLRSWMGASPPWRDILAVFVQAGRGLGAAHASGVIHRDFKPDNVMLREDGRVVVMDFGLARPEILAASDEAGLSPPSLAGPVRLSLTQTGSLLGTPAYMSPEQFTTARVDARSDQFSFCIALFEALYGQHPFPAATLMEQAVAVASGTPVSPKGGRTMPAWVRRVILRGLRRDPDERWPAMAAMIDALERKGERRVLFAVALGIALVLLGLWAARWIYKINERNAQVNAHLQNAAALMVKTRQDSADGESMRSAAFAAFDAGDREEGEKKYLTSIEHNRVIREGFRQAIQAIEQALALDGTNDRSRGAMLDALYEYAVAAERGGERDFAEEIVERLKIYDGDGSTYARWVAPADLYVRSEPSGARVVLERYVNDGGQRRIARADELGITPLPPQTLDRGSYRLRFDLPGRTPVLYPILVTRGETLDIEVVLPTAASVPDGFVYVPAGRFLYGVGGHEGLRASFFAEPMHTVTTPAYLIGRYEITYKDYLAYLSTLPPERRSSAQSTGEILQDSVRLAENPDGWQFAIHQGFRVYTARSGELLHYEGRTHHESVEWERLPLTGITVSEAQEFLAWLDSSGRVPGARLCNEYEWERAAHGADDRHYAHGDRLEASEANIDKTYGRISSAYGPDPVGSYPKSESPFGLYDTAGNVYEMTVSPHDADAIVARGGAYYYHAFQAEIANRTDIPAGFRHSTTGLRACADWPKSR